MDYTKILDDQLPSGRRKLVSVIRASGDVVQIDDVVATLSITRTNAAKRIGNILQGLLGDLPPEVSGFP